MVEKNTLESAVQAQVGTTSRVGPEKTSPSSPVATRRSSSPAGAYRTLAIVNPRSPYCRDLALGHCSSRLALHRAGQAYVERLHRELQRSPARRMPQRARLPHARRGARNDRGMASRLQSPATARQSRRLDAGRVRGAKKTGNATARRGPNNRRTLLMIGGKLGSRPGGTAQCIRRRVFKIGI
jgi:hypothetical protein